MVQIQCLINAAFKKDLKSKIIKKNKVKIEALTRMVIQRRLRLTVQ